MTIMVAAVTMPRRQSVKLIDLAKKQR